MNPWHPPGRSVRGVLLAAHVKMQQEKVVAERARRDPPASPVHRHTPPGSDIDSVIDVRAVLQQGFRDVDITDLPPLLRPTKGALGLVDYEKVFCADLTSGQDIFEMRGIDRTRGCIVIVRPDQYVAHILPLDAHAELAAYFAGVLLPSDRPRTPA